MHTVLLEGGKLQTANIGNIFRNCDKEGKQKVQQLSG